MHLEKSIHDMYRNYFNRPFQNDICIASKRSLARDLHIRPSSPIHLNISRQISCLSLIKIASQNFGFHWNVNKNDALDSQGMLYPPKTRELPSYRRTITIAGALLCSIECLISIWGMPGLWVRWESSPSIHHIVRCPAWEISAVHGLSRDGRNWWC